MGFEREKNIGSWRDRNSLNPRFEWKETNARNRDTAKKSNAYVLKSYYSMAGTITENILRKRYFFDTRFTEKFCRPLLVHLRFYSEVFCESQIDFSFLQQKLLKIGRILLEVRSINRSITKCILTLLDRSNVIFHCDWIFVFSSEHVRCRLKTIRVRRQRSVISDQLVKRYK